MTLVYFVGDALPEFHESDHPRDASGKFTDGSGGTKAAAPPAPKPDFRIAKVLALAGYKKTKSATETAYVHPSGAKVVLHPHPQGKKSSAIFTSTKPGSSEKQGSGPQKLMDLLRVSLEKQKEAAAQPSGIASQSALNSSTDAVAYGMGVTDNTGAHIHLNTQTGVQPELGLSIEKSTGKWKLKNFSNGEEYEGSGSSMLNAALKHADEVEANPNGEETEQQSKSASSPSFKTFEALGFPEHSIRPGGMTLFWNDKGAEIEYNDKTDEWTAQAAPGSVHLTKEGTGIENLKQLLSGQPAIIPPGGSPPWKNSSKVIGKKRAQQSEAQKAGAAEQSKAQKAEAGANATYEKLKASAPSPDAHQKNALAHYGDGGYSTVNGALRKDPSFMNDTVKNLDSFLAKSSFPEDAMVYRGVKGEYASVIKSVIMEGTKFQDRGFISTSSNPRIGKNFEQGLLFKINLPKGSRAAAIGAYSGHHSEHEVLLPRGTAYVVKSYDPKTGVVECEIEQGHL